MDEKMRVMTKRPLNAETPTESLRSWITDNEVFFKRNQGQFPDAPINLAQWALCVDGYPLRALALGWTGANCVKWLNKITVLNKPAEGFFMDKVYRVFQKGEDPKSGEVVTDIDIKSIIVEPTKDQTLSAGIVPIRGAAYAGEAGIVNVEVSVDQGATWHSAELIGPEQPYAWRHWEYLWEVRKAGEYTIMARATDTNGLRQPETAHWNVLGYGNNGVKEHAITVRING